MLDTRSVLRCGLIACIAGIVGLALSVAVAAGEGGFPLAFATQQNVQSGSNVQSASGVLKTLYRLALEEGYSEADAEDIVAAAARLIQIGSVPPGTILQVSKQLLLTDLPAAELIGLLEEIAQRIANGEPPGQVINEILTRGNGKNSAADASANGTRTEGNARESGNGNAESGSDAEDDDDGSGNGYSGNGNGGGNSNSSD